MCLVMGSELAAIGGASGVLCRDASAAGDGEGYEPDTGLARFAVLVSSIDSVACRRQGSGLQLEKTLHDAD